MGRPESNNDIVAILRNWEVKAFTISNAQRYCAEQGVSRATFYRKKPKLVERGVFILLAPGDNPIYMLSPSVEDPFTGYASTALAVLSTLPQFTYALTRALYAPVAAAQKATVRPLTAEDLPAVRTAQADVLASLDVLRNLVDRMESVDLTDPRITVILNESDAVQQLIDIRKGLDSP